MEVINDLLREAAKLNVNNKDVIKDKEGDKNVIEDKKQGTVMTQKK